MGQWFPPGSLVSSTSGTDISSSSFHHLDTTLAIADVLSDMVIALYGINYNS